MIRSIVVLAVVIVSAAFAACSGNTTGNSNTPVTGNNTNQNINANVVAGNNPGNAASAGYPDEVVKEFLASCEEAGSDRRFCQCVLDKVQARYTFEEFSVIESKISANQAPGDFVEFSGKARAECMK